MDGGASIASVLKRGGQGGRKVGCLATESRLRGEFNLVYDLITFILLGSLKLRFAIFIDVVVGSSNSTLAKIFGSVVFVS